MSNYDFKQAESKWQEWWEAEGLYHYDFDSKKPTYSIDNPPRYASGPLHIGHSVHYTHIDFAARYHRMKGCNVYFPLCFDVNGMPIEVNVEKKFNIRMREYDRQKFIKLCREFAQANIGEMTRQFKILGESMDPTIYYQTDAEYYRRLTQISFIKLFNKGLVYKGEFPINWCPRCGTALAESEVEYKLRTTKLNYINFTMVETGEKVLIATTRPELLCTCHLVAIHPDDKRSDTMSGKMIRTPVYNKEVRVLPDDSVVPDFGTGLVMICSIGDKDDLDWIRRYDIKVLKGIDEMGKMTPLAGKYAGMEIADARKAIIEDMKKDNLLVKQEDLEQNVGCCWRCKSPIEFLVAPQWFLKTLDFKEEVLARSNEIDWHPKYMKIRLEEWVNSLSWDWVLSRQRYFATPIPVWECLQCHKAYVPEEKACYIDPTVAPPPMPKCEACGGALKGSEEVFDTWMDSSISPLFNTFWERDAKKFAKLFPMSLRPQSHDIIRTWAFYTILRTHLLCDSKPWNEIMMGGFIMAEDGTPMHASKGNAVDPLRILEEYGADSLRYYATTCALGVDNAFRTMDVKRGHQLSVKIINLEKLISNSFANADMAKVRKLTVKNAKLKLVDRWILDKYSNVVKDATAQCEDYHFEQAVRSVVDFLWHDLADNYLEMVKYRIYQHKDDGLLFTLYNVGLGIVKLLAPFLPHVTEEVYQTIYKQYEADKSIHVSSWPDPILFDPDALAKGEIVKELTASIRRWKGESGLALNAPLGTVTIASEAFLTTLGDAKDDIAQTVVAKEVKLAKNIDLEETLVEIKLNFSKVGPMFKKDAKDITAQVKVLAFEQLKSAMDQGGLKLTLASGQAVTLGKELFEMRSEKRPHGGGAVIQSKDAVILIEQ